LGREHVMRSGVLKFILEKLESYGQIKSPENHT